MARAERLTFKLFGQSRARAIWMACEFAPAATRRRRRQWPMADGRRKSAGGGIECPSERRARRRRLHRAPTSRQIQINCRASFGRETRSSGGSLGSTLVAQTWPVRLAGGQTSAPNVSLSFLFTLSLSIVVERLQAGRSESRQISPGRRARASKWRARPGDSFAARSIAIKCNAITIGRTDGRASKRRPSGRNWRRVSRRAKTMLPPLLLLLLLALDCCPEGKHNLAVFSAPTDELLPPPQARR